MLYKLSILNVFAFPDFEAAISGSRKFRLVKDISADGLGVVIEHQQPDGSIQPLRYISRTTLDNVRKWSISELDFAAIVGTIKRNRRMFYRTFFEVETGHQPIQNVANWSDKSNRVQRWFDSLNEYRYNFTLKQRSKNANVNADVLSHLPLSATAERLQPRYRPTDPSDLAIFFGGASGIHPRLRTSSDSSLGELAKDSGGLTNALGGLAATPADVFVRGGGSSARAKIWSTGVASSVEGLIEGHDVRGPHGLRRDQLDFSNSCEKGRTQRTI